MSAVLFFWLQSTDADALDFSRGRDGVRARLLDAGPSAVLSLIERRPAAPERVGRLLLEIKAGAAVGRGAAEAVRAACRRIGLDFPGGSFREAFGELASELPLLYDPSLDDEALGRRVEEFGLEAPGWELLDRLATAGGLDWGFFYGRILFARPARLWPAEVPTPAAAVSDGQEAAWVEDLGHPSPDVREAAHERLAARGAAVEGLLRRAAGDADPERSARGRDLLARLRGRIRKAAFGPAAFDVDPAGIRRLLGERRLTLRWSYHPVDSYLFDLLLAAVPGRTEIRVDGVAGRAFADWVDVPVDAALALTCHAWGLDAWIEDGKLVVDRRDPGGSSAAGR
jgi:hypothetical protein